MGYSMFKMKKIDKAIDNYKKSAELNPKYFSCYYYLGLSYCDTRQYEEARRAFQRCIDINP